jgi:hypothetical protein
MWIRVLCFASALLLSACHSTAGVQEAPLPGAVASHALTAAMPLWDREGVAAQPRMAELQLRTPRELGYAPGTTPWRAAGIEVPPRFRSPSAAGAATPGALVTALALPLGWMDPLGEEVWEQTTRVWLEGEDAAVAVVLRWGLKDDALAGHDHRVHMRRGGEGWYIERMEERFHCRRGVTAEDLCI